MKHLVTLLFLVFSIVGFSQSPGKEAKLAFYKLPNEGMPELKVRMFTNMDTVKTKNVFKLAVSFDLMLNWYTYSKEDSEKNLPTTIDLNIPKGFEIIKEVWPTPLEVPGRKGGMDKVYKNDFMVVYHIKASKKKKSDATITANIEWQVCDPTICMAGEATIETKIVVGNSNSVSILSSLLPE
ncbi:protein-disulfide reductase DsbD domain-containing protein [Flavivirga spongiicola]|uniref:Protein-disulfide reductase DsbD N-terminal domain-containing protein n=1 Tax=Flavivirga spongiicola TaxID=421621 RepID=A0ABU7XZE9_9FLAO|nr:protein-disulfide reductase DsbD domain-containing protein [Flavivirga sp. MEBiC05379]MDO5980823.1 protein-disulfide reductase DsbD family protein [Flavivirga sp. MEBiC05379]